MRRFASASLMLPTVLCWVGCGGGTSPSAADVARDWAQARNRGDAAKVCALSTPQIAQQLASGYGSCEAYYRAEGPASKSIPLTRGAVLVAVDVRESGDRANGQIVIKKGPLTTFAMELRRQNGKWLVSMPGP